MSLRLPAFIVYALLGCLLLPTAIVAQSDGEIPLGDLARQVRKQKAPDAEPVIDNDNLSQVMDEVQTKRLKGEPVFSIDNAGKNFRMTSPDGTCSLSFDANAAAIISNPYVPENLPQSELMKLDGPATIDGNTLQLSVYNGTRYNVKEITVGLTIVRRQATTASYFGAARLIPAADGANATPGSAANGAGNSPEKRSDLTLLYHLKGSAAPFTTTVFHESLGVQLDPDQEWHWAIVQAAGVLPKASESGKH
ncbi:MAG: hypothetical protein ACRD2U_12640 [Terriglobales bacterium]